MGDPTGACAEEAPGPPAESEAPGTEINGLYYTDAQKNCRQPRISSSLSTV
jgi:hypothetical protein